MMSNSDSDSAGDMKIVSAKGDSGGASQESLSLSKTTKSWSLKLPGADAEDEVLVDERLQHQQLSFGLKLFFTQEFDDDIVQSEDEIDEDNQVEGEDDNCDNEGYDNFVSACLNVCDIPIECDEEEGNEEEENEKDEEAYKNEEECLGEEDCGGEKSVLTASMAVLGELKSSVTATLRLMSAATGEELAKCDFNFTAGQSISENVLLFEGSSEDLTERDVELICLIQDHQQEQVVPALSWCKKTAPNLAESAEAAEDPARFGIEETMSQAVSRLLLDPSACDAWLVFGEKRVACHSLVLRARSPVIARMLGSDVATRNIIVKTSLATIEAVDSFLRFLYTDVLDPKWSFGLMGVMAMAAEFEVAPLERAIERAMETEVSVCNVIKLLVMATDFKVNYLRKIAMAFIVENTLAVMDTEEFKKMSVERPELLCEILREKSSN